jgi:DNA-directed RNA polymerase specialized sigma24 family protein
VSCSARRSVRAQGDETAWRHLPVRYNGLVWWVVRGFRLDEEQSADIVQLTWTTLVEHIGRIRDPERLGGWLAQTARRLCTAALRKAAREQRLQEELRFNPISYAQISRLLHMPAGSIGPTRARALHRLRDELAQLDVTDAGVA